MATLQDIIRSRKAGGGDLRAFTEMTIRKEMEMVVRDLESYIKTEISNASERVARHLESTTRKGDKGDTVSLMGPQGLRGEQGLQGVQGPSGKAGKDSIALGPPGLQGDPGRDGSPDNPQEIVKKLNTTENLVEMKVIRGLQGVLERFQRGLKEKGGGKAGGGMGNIQHEQTAISSATTTVITSYSIAGGGFALWAFYNGQMVSRGTDYTISGKTITLLFTPSDSTVFDVIYIR